MATIEYVSDYPRPPKIELISGSVSIYINNEIIANDCEISEFVKHFTRQVSTSNHQHLPPEHCTKSQVVHLFVSGRA